MRTMWVATGAAALMLAGCATTGAGEQAGAAPDLAPVAGGPVSANGRLVLACVREAMDAERLDMIGDDGESRLIRFTCRGETARVLFDALGERAAAIGAEWTRGVVVFRSTERIQRDLYGADVCSRDGEAYACDFNLNLGGFIR